MLKRILILAAGGGHTGYGYSLSQYLFKKAELTFLVPSGDKLSQQKLTKFGKVDFLIKSRGPKTPNAYFIPNLLKSFISSSKFVKGYFDIVISTGSNFCFPPALWGWLRGIPLINIESPIRFTRPALTTKFLEPFSTITALHWPEQKKILNGIVIGPLLPQVEVKPWEGGYILVTGGTFGHNILFDTISKSNWKNVVLQTGQINTKRYRKEHPEWEIFNYTNNFQKVMAGADVIISHFGSTILEAVSLEKPVVIVVNPEWTRTVGIEDAKLLAKNVNAEIITDITIENLKNAIVNAKENKIPVFSNGAKNLSSIILKL